MAYKLDRVVIVIDVAIPGDRKKNMTSQVTQRTFKRAGNTEHCDSGCSRFQDPQLKHLCVSVVFIRSAGVLQSVKKRVRTRAI